MNSKLKGIISILIFMVYLFQSYILTYVFGLFNIDITSLSNTVRVIISFSVELVLLMILIFIFKDILKEKLKDFKQNNVEYFNKYFKYWFLILGIMFISNGIISIINGGDIANNEEIIMDAFKLNPIYIYITGVFLAPLFEELIFRQGVRCIFKNNIIFILFSGLLFGSMHVLTSLQTPLDLLYLIPYSAPGFIFAYILTKSDNVFVPILIHMFHNGLAISLEFILLIFG